MHTHLVGLLFHENYSMKKFILKYWNYVGFPLLRNNMIIAL